MKQLGTYLHQTGDDAFVEIDASQVTVKHKGAAIEPGQRVVVGDHTLEPLEQFRPPMPTVKVIDELFRFAYQPPWATIRRCDPDGFELRGAA